MTLPDRLNDWIDRAHEDDTLSWIMHGVQGLVFGFVGGWLGLALGGTGFAGLLLTLGVFGHREADNALGTLRKEGLRAAQKKVTEDGAMDLMAPYILAVVGTALALIVR